MKRFSSFRREETTLLIQHNIIQFTEAHQRIEPCRKESPQSTLVLRNCVGEQPLILRNARLKEEMLENPESYAASTIWIFGSEKKASAINAMFFVERSTAVCPVVEVTLPQKGGTA